MVVFRLKKLAPKPAIAMFNGKPKASVSVAYDSYHETLSPSARR